VVVIGVVSRICRHGLFVGLIAVIFQLTTEDFHFARGRQTQRYAVAGDTLHDDLDTVSDDNSLSNFPAQDQHGSLRFEFPRSMVLFECPRRRRKGDATSSQAATISWLRPIVFENSPFPCKRGKV
jgi:hypothetical protein